MKKLMLFFALGFFVFTSCQKDELYLEDDNQEWSDDQEGDYEGEWNEDEDSGSDDHDHDFDDLESSTLSLYEVEGNNISLIKDFDVSNNLKSMQADKTKHQEIWNYVTNLIPLEYRNKFGQFELFNGGGNLLGYVKPVEENDLSKWVFALAMDEAEDLDNINFKSEFTYTTIHELGHIVTLNDDQLNVDIDPGSCDGYHSGEGCSKQNSYIRQLVNLGWTDILDELETVGPDEIYSKYKSRFISDYAATNPAEDIAEVFTVFIIQENAPSGNSIAAQKVKLLYKFPELVQMRKEIRASVPPALLRTLNIDGYKALLPKLTRGHKGH